jgi:hypothetical protein
MGWKYGYQLPPNPARQFYSLLMIEIKVSDSRGLPAIQSFIQLAAEKEINGMLSTAWDDRSPHYETYWRGHIASAEYQLES